jgi:predicted ArsR family transcriptional regulator
MSDMPTSDRLLLHLKTHGPVTAQSIAEAFGMTLMGIHKALNGLVAGEWVRFEDVVEGRGRPKRYFSLTGAGHSRFPDRHAELNAEIIATVRSVFGEEGLERLISERERRQEQRYADVARGGLGDRVAALADIRAAEGYMARVEATADGDYLLVEDHCPICAAAESCQGFCRSELTLFQALVGTNATVERQDHLLSGGRRCTYVIRTVRSP